MPTQTYVVADTKPYLVDLSSRWFQPPVFAFSYVSSTNYISVYVDTANKATV